MPPGRVVKWQIMLQYGPPNARAGLCFGWTATTVAEGYFDCPLNCARMGAPALSRARELPARNSNCVPKQFRLSDILARCWPDRRKLKFIGPDVRLNSAGREPACKPVQEAELSVPRHPTGISARAYFDYGNDISSCTESMCAPI